MELTGDILVPAARDKVWDALNDPAVLMRCIPGCEHIEVTGPDEKLARVLVRVGPVRARFVGRIRMADVRPGHGCVLHFQGSGGAAGMASGQSRVDLVDEAGGTRVRYSAQASVGGKLGQIGGRMMDAAAKQMADQFFAALNTQLGAAPVAALPGAPTAVPMPLPAPAPLPQGEWLRVLWFLLGSLSTGFGVWIASRLTH